MAAGNCSIFSAVLIMMACQQNGPQRDATNTPCDRFTLTCKEVSMPSHRSRSARREKLSEICRQLGEHASPAEIREEAYRVGFGAVNSSMLIHVRNALWPNRCHRTNKIRALLCHQCNLAIGNFKDDIQHMEAAIAYLRAHSEGGA